MGITANVVADAPILAAWGNEIRDRTVQVFASVAERSAQWTAPPEGAFSYIRDVDQVHIFDGTGWVCITPVTAATATVENRTSATYGDMPLGAAPSVSILTGTKALVTVSGEINNGGGSSQVYASFAVSGATTQVANDASAISLQGAGIIIASSYTALRSTLTRGTNTFTMKYRAASGTVYAQYRSITVVGIP